MENLLNKIIEQREQIQEDIITILDGIDDEIISKVCQVVVDRMKLLERYI